MVYFKPIKNTINIAGLAKAIIDIIVRHYNFIESIVNNIGSFLP